MKSHSYQVKLSELMRIIGYPLIFICSFSLLLHAGVWFSALPTPIPVLDADRTILLHQASMSQSEQQADTLLIGDSSCMMNVSARLLSELLPGRHQVLNLGTLSYLDLASFAGFVRNYVSANPERLRTIVLLMHPEALRRVAASDYHLDVLRHFYAGTDFCSPAASSWTCAIGSEVFKGRIWSRLIPNALDGAFGLKYGFTSGLRSFLLQQNGSLIDPQEYDGSVVRGSAEYRLAKHIEAGSRRFRLAVPADAKLFVGITPVPEGFVSPNYPEVHARMLSQWAEWLQADAVLDDLPPVLPDDAFATTTHLNEQARSVYTESVAQAVAKHRLAE